MPLDPQRLLGLSLPAREVSYGDRDAMLYAVAVGLGTQPGDLHYVYEQHGTVVPSFANTLAFDDSWLASAGIDLRDVVHGALDLTFDRTLRLAGRVEIAGRITGLTDKGPGRAGIVLQESHVGQDGTPACTIRSTLFVRGAGGFGGSVGAELAPEPIPDGAPDGHLPVATSDNQALLFRLLGDRNPLHVDPAVATASGFPRPILHGAATFGTVCAAVLKAFCGSEPARLSRFAARFAGPLYPGETMDVAFWTRPTRIAFRAVARERGTVVLDNGLAEVTR